MPPFRDPALATPEKVAEVIASGRVPVIQFGSASEIRDLERVNALCREFGADLQVRFFSWQWREFDAGILEQLPEVANLSLDTLRAVTNLDAVARLPKLTRLRFGVHEQPNGDFLKTFPLERLSQLILAENKKRNFDLAPLARAAGLENVFIQGHDRNIEVISDLPKLSSVSLSGFPKRHDLAFLNSLAGLRKLLLILGSRETIAELTNPALEELSIVWVRLLENLGPLGRFPRLRMLKIEDQLRLRELDVSALNLRTLTIANCKQLTVLKGLQVQRDLERFWVRDTKLEVQAKLRGLDASEAAGAVRSGAI